MKPTTLTFLLVVAVGSSSVHAAEHLMHVSEVMLSNNNDTNIRFIELADPGLEPFPSPPYKVVVYNAAGTLVESATLFPTATVPGTIPASTQRVYVATAQSDAMFSKTRDGTLTMPLPVDGQACFENGGGTKIHCVAWGCITTLAQAGADRAASPPTGQSAQRQANGMWHLAAPTADVTPNAAGTAAAACPTAPDAGVVDGPVNTGPDAGVMPDAGGGNNNNPDDDGGCCQVDGPRGAAGVVLLAFFVGLVLRRRRR